MLQFLYTFLENLLLQLCHGIEYHPLNLFKISIYGVIGLICYFGLSYVISSFHTRCVECFSLTDFNLIKIFCTIVRMFNEIKFILILLIIILMISGFLYNQYIRTNPRGLLHLLNPLWDLDLDLNDGDMRAIDLLINDSQNVHNSSVTKYVIEAVKILQDKEKLNAVIALSHEQLFADMTDWLQHETPVLPKGDMGDVPPPKALSVIRQIQKINGFHVATDLNETEIIRLVWQRIHHPINHINLADLKESLLLQLADCYLTDESVVCVTGRITRILQTLECLDVEKLIDLKPTWAIRNSRILQSLYR